MTRFQSWLSLAAHGRMIMKLRWKFALALAVTTLALVPESPIPADAADAPGGPETTVPMLPNDPQVNSTTQDHPDPNDDGHGHGNISGDGLGAYGPVGRIDRQDLPHGLSEYVSDAALRLAQAPALAEARSAWNEPAIDFVDQVDYQLAFRQHYDFLELTPEAVAAALTEKNKGKYLDDLNLFLTRDEVQEMRRREALGNQIERLGPILDGDAPSGAVSNLVDIVQDQLNGGRLVAYVLDENLSSVDRVRRLAGPGNLDVVTVPYSSVAYRGFQEELSRRIAEAGLSDYELGIERSRTTMMVVLRVSDDEAVPADLLEGLPGDAVGIVEVSGSVVAEASKPHVDHPENQYLTTGVSTKMKTPTGDRHCTWGLAGHTASYHYIVTAGHCFRSGGDVGGWKSDYNVWSRNEVYNYTQGSNYVWSVDFIWDIDAGRITSTNIAATNCIHWDNNHCAYGTESIADNNSWETGSDVTCASLGESNVFRCGVIDKEGVEVGGHPSLVRVKMKVIPGDSGSGATYSEIIDGLITHQGQIGSINKTDVAYFQMAENVRSGLGPGFDFNCYSWGLTSANTWDWNTCPVVNR